VAAPDQVTDNENKDTVGLFCRADQSLRLFPFMNSENKCFLWESDSQSLLTLKWIEGKSNETLRVGRIWLAALNSPRPDPPVATTVRPVPVEPVAEVTLAEADSRQSTGMLPMIEPLALQSDSNHLFYVTAEYSKEPKSYGYDVRQALGCLDLRTGKCAQVLSLFSFEPEVKGIGWYSGRP